MVELQTLAESALKVSAIVAVYHECCRVRCLQRILKHGEITALGCAEAFNSSLILFEIFSRARRLGEWERIVARNRWFQQKVCSCLRSQRVRSYVYY